MCSHFKGKFVFILQTFAAERIAIILAVVVILCIGTIAIETQVTSNGIRPYSARPIEPIVTCVVQSARIDAPSADEE